MRHCAPCPVCVSVQNLHKQLEEAIQDGEIWVMQLKDTEYELESSRERVQQQATEILHKASRCLLTEAATHTSRTNSTTTFPTPADGSSTIGVRVNPPIGAAASTSVKPIGDGCSWNPLKTHRTRVPHTEPSCPQASCVPV